MGAPTSLSKRATQIDSALKGDVDRPWCVHRIYEELFQTPTPGSRDDDLVVTQKAAEELVAIGKARRESISAISIGVHCEDTLYWSALADKKRLADFGPEYEWPTVLQRLGAHIQCRGL
jgi:hypothetical protein